MDVFPEARVVMDSPPRGLGQYGQRYGQSYMGDEDGSYSSLRRVDSGAGSQQQQQQQSYGQYQQQPLRPQPVDYDAVERREYAQHQQGLEPQQQFPVHAGSRELLAPREPAPFSSPRRRVQEPSPRMRPGSWERAPAEEPREAANWGGQQEPEGQQRWQELEGHRENPLRAVESPRYRHHRRRSSGGDLDFDASLGRSSSARVKGTEEGWDREMEEHAQRRRWQGHAREAGEWRGQEEEWEGGMGEYSDCRSTGAYQHVRRRSDGHEDDFRCKGAPDVRGYPGTATAEGRPLSGMDEAHCLGYAPEMQEARRRFHEAAQRRDSDEYIQRPMDNGRAQGGYGPAAGHQTEYSPGPAQDCSPGPAQGYSPAPGSRSPRMAVTVQVPNSSYNRDEKLPDLRSLGDENSLHLRGPPVLRSSSVDHLANPQPGLCVVGMGPPMSHLSRAREMIEEGRAWSQPSSPHQSPAGRAKLMHGASYGGSCRGSPAYSLVPAERGYDQFGTDEPPGGRRASLGYAGGSPVNGSPGGSFVGQYSVRQGPSPLRPPMQGEGDGWQGGGGQGEGDGWRGDDRQREGDGWRRGDRQGGFENNGWLKQGQHPEPSLVRNGVPGAAHLRTNAAVSPRGPVSGPSRFGPGAQQQGRLSPSPLRPSGIEREDVRLEAQQMRRREQQYAENHYATRQGGAVEEGPLRRQAGMPFRGPPAELLMPRSHTSHESARPDPARLEPRGPRSGELAPRDMEHAFAARRVRGMGSSPADAVRSRMAFPQSPSFNSPRRPAVRTIPRTTSLTETGEPSTPPGGNAVQSFPVGPTSGDMAVSRPREQHQRSPLARAGDRDVETDPERNPGRVSGSGSSSGSGSETWRPERQRQHADGKLQDPGQQPAADVHRRRQEDGQRPKADAEQMMAEVLGPGRAKPMTDMELMARSAAPTVTRIKSVVMRNSMDSGTGSLEDSLAEASKKKMAVRTKSMMVKGPSDGAQLAPEGKAVRKEQLAESGNSGTVAAARERSNKEQLDDALRAGPLDVMETPPKREGGLAQGEKKRDAEVPRVERKNTRRVPSADDSNPSPADAAASPSRKSVSFDDAEGSSKEAACEAEKPKRSGSFFGRKQADPSEDLEWARTEGNPWDLDGKKPALKVLLQKLCIVQPKKPTHSDAEQEKAQAGTGPQSPKQNPQGPRRSNLGPADGAPAAPQAAAASPARRAGAVVRQNSVEGRKGAASTREAASVNGGSANMVPVDLVIERSQAAKARLQKNKTAGKAQKDLDSGEPSADVDHDDPDSRTAKGGAAMVHVGSDPKLTGGRGAAAARGVQQSSGAPEEDQRRMSQLGRVQTVHGRGADGRTAGFSPQRTKDRNSWDGADPTSRQLPGVEAPYADARVSDSPNQGQPGMAPPLLQGSQDQGPSQGQPGQSHLSSGASSPQVVVPYSPASEPYPAGKFPSRDSSASSGNSQVPLGAATSVPMEPRGMQAGGREAPSRQTRHLGRRLSKDSWAFPTLDDRRPVSPMALMVSGGGGPGAPATGQPPFSDDECVWPDAGPSWNESPPGRTPQPGQAARPGAVFPTSQSERAPPYQRGQPPTQRDQHQAGSDIVSATLVPYSELTLLDMDVGFPHDGDHGLPRPSGLGQKETKGHGRDLSAEVLSPRGSRASGPRAGSRSPPRRAGQGGSQEGLRVRHRAGHSQSEEDEDEGEGGGLERDGEGQGGRRVKWGVVEVAKAHSKSSYEAKPALGQQACSRNSDEEEHKPRRRSLDEEEHRPRRWSLEVAGAEGGKREKSSMARKGQTTPERTSTLEEKAKGGKKKEERGKKESVKESLEPIGRKSTEKGMALQEDRGSLAAAGGEEAAPEEGSMGAHEGHAEEPGKGGGLRTAAATLRMSKAGFVLAQMFTGVYAEPEASMKRRSQWNGPPAHFDAKQSGRSMSPANKDWGVPPARTSSDASVQSLAKSREGSPGPKGAPSAMKAKDKGPHQKSRLAQDDASGLPSKTRLGVRLSGHESDLCRKGARGFSADEDNSGDLQSDKAAPQKSKLSRKMEK